MSQSAYTVERIEEGFWRIDEKGVCSFLLVGTERSILIDSGFGTGNLRAAIEELTDLPVLLVNTHADGDHIGCNALFDRAYMHPAEYDRYQSKGGAAPSAVWEGDVLTTGAHALEVLLIPGHTPGSIALLDARRRILFGGDSVQAGAIFMFGLGRNLHAYVDSMERLQRMRDRFDVVYTSHGPATVSPDIIPELIHGAQAVLRGEVEGKDPPREGMDAKYYAVGSAKFLY